MYSIAIVVLLIFNFTTSIDAVDFQFKGESEIQYRVFDADNDSSTQDTNLLVTNQAETTFTTKTSIFKSKLWMQQDSIDKNKSAVIIEKLYMLIQKDSYDVSLGAKILNWSTLEAFHPADVMNSKNYDSSFKNPVKIGEPMISYSYYYNEFVVGVYYMPYIMNPIFAPQSSRFKTSQLHVGSARYFNKSSEEITNNQFNQIAIKLDHVLNQADISVYYIDHIDRSQPIFSVDNLNVIPNYFRVKQFGFSLQSPLKELLLKAEYGYRKFVGSAPNINPSDHSQLALGTEYTYYHQNKFESTLFVEYQVIPDVSRVKRASLGVFQHDLLAGYRLNLNNSQSSELQWFVFKDLDVNNEYFLSLNFSQRFFNMIKGNIGLQWVYSNTNQSIGFQTIENADFCYVSTNYFF